MDLPYVERSISQNVASSNIYVRNVKIIVNTYVYDV